MKHIQLVKTSLAEDNLHGGNLIEFHYDPETDESNLKIVIGEEHLIWLDKKDIDKFITDLQEVVNEGNKLIKR